MRLGSKSCLVRGRNSEGKGNRRRTRPRTIRARKLIKLTHSHSQRQPAKRLLLVRMGTRTQRTAHKTRRPANPQKQMRIDVNSELFRSRIKSNKLDWSFKNTKERSTSEVSNRDKMSWRTRKQNGQCLQSCREGCYLLLSLI